MKRLSWNLAWLLPPWLLLMGLLLLCAGLATADAWRYREFQRFKKTVEADCGCGVDSGEGRYFDASFVMVTFGPENSAEDLAKFVSHANSHPGAPGGYAIEFDGGEWSANDIAPLGLLREADFLNIAGDSHFTEEARETLRELPNVRFVEADDP